MTTLPCEGRWVPIFPELRPYLEDAFGSAPEGAKYVITSKRDTNQKLRTRMLKIIRRAGEKPWPRLFQNLRASRETELAAEYPLHVVTAWIGNSVGVAMKSYLQMTEDYFERAAKSGAIDPESALRKPVQRKAALPCSEQQKECEGFSDCEVTREDAICFKPLQIKEVPPIGLEPITR